MKFDLLLLIHQKKNCFFFFFFQDKMMLTHTVVTKGFKWFKKGPDGALLGKNGFIHRVGHVSVLENEGELVPCENGLHFCKDLSDVFRYVYVTECEVAIHRVEAYDDIVDDDDGTMSVCSALKVLEPVVMTPKLWLTAIINSNARAIGWMSPAERTAELCLAAVTQDGYAIQYLGPEWRTARLCLAAVTQNGNAIQLLGPTERTAEVCLATATQNGDAIRFLRPVERTAEVCLAAVTEYGRAIQYLSPAERTSEVWDVV
jgi:hypothetical protein